MTTTSQFSSATSNSQAQGKEVTSYWNRHDPFLTTVGGETIDSD